MSSLVNIITTEEERWCLAPEKKIKQIEDEVGFSINVISVKQGDTETLRKEIEKLYEKCLFPKFMNFIIETKDSSLIDVVNEFTTIHTGESKETIELDDNKAKLKEFLRDKVIATPEGFDCNKKADVKQFKYPCFIKPADFEDSIGIDETSVCRTQEEAQKVLDKFEIYNTILVEEYLTGEEYTVTVVHKGNNQYKIYPARMDMKKNKRGDKILGYEEKQGDDCKLVADFSEEKAKEICDLAFNTFNAIGANNYARIDIRDDENGIAKVLEVNLYAGLGKDGYMADCYRANGLDYFDMLNDVICSAIHYKGGKDVRTYTR